MKLPGDMNIEGLSMLGNFQAEGTEGLILGTRMFDTDGDGQNDLFVIDYDNDGTIDGVVRGLDTDHDGVLDTFVQYDEDGEIQAVGQVDPETREFEVIDQDEDDFEETLSSLGLADTPAPDDALFTTFDDPYFTESYGTFGEEVPDISEPIGGFASVDLNEVDEGDLGSLGSGVAVDSDDRASAQSDGASGSEESDASLPEVTPRVVEIEDYSGAGDGSDLHAKIDQNGDGLADDDQKLFRTSDGTWHGDVNRDGYSDEVAFDRDQDGHIDSVDTTGQGSSTDTVDAEQAVAPESENIVDTQPGEDDSAAACSLDDAGDASSSDSDSGSSYDSGSTSDSGSSYDSDSGGSGSTSDSDAGSTTVDSGSSDDSSS
jgi:hypothetical protein